MSDLVVTHPELTDARFLVVSVHGALDQRSGPELVAATLGAVTPGTRVVVLDLSDVEFCSSAGMNALVQLDRAATAMGAACALAALPVRLARRLELTGLNQVLRCYPDVAAATADPS
ncbi:STAS domain-containing protein [Amycolatopsis sp. NPDC049252]|uniref:STAS domain-containing protein n=1 Tax=Amycolatopsis sp. NPDC049252 TaxID=3363933 RepID=UPI0037232A4A